MSSNPSQSCHQKRGCKKSVFSFVGATCGRHRMLNLQHCIYGQRSCPLRNYDFFYSLFIELARVVGYAPFGRRLLCNANPNPVALRARSSLSSNPSQSCHQKTPLFKGSFSMARFVHPFAKNRGYILNLFYSLILYRFILP